MFSGLREVAENWLYTPEEKERQRKEQNFFNLIGSGNVQGMQTLVDQGIDPTAPMVSRPGTPVTFTPLHRAVIREDSKALSFLLSVTPIHEIDTPEGEHGDTPLMMAVKLGQEQTARHLMSQNANPLAANYEGVTPFMEMCRRGHQDLAIETAQSLHKQSRLTQALAQTDENGLTSLFHSLAGPSQEAKETLLSMHKEAGIDTAGKHGPQGYTALHFSSALGDGPTIRHLIDVHKNDVNALSNKDRLTPAMVAAWANQPNSIKMLSSYPGVHLDAVSRNNMDTALHMAAVRGHTDVAVALVHCGAKTHMRNEQNQTPADLAAYLGNAKTAQALRHLDPETQNGLVQSLTKNATKALEFIQEMAPISHPRPR